jgi:hypothetical protein
MTTRPFGRAAGVAALVLTLWRCSGDDTKPATDSASGTGSARIDACALVPKSEVELIVGTPVTNATGNLSEHNYTKPVSYTASCMYLGERTVMLGVNYPVPAGRTTSEQLAGRITEHLRSQVGSDPSTDELFRRIQVRPVGGLAGPAAEYAMLDQTTLELHAGDYRLKIMAPSLGNARALAEKATSRLE